MDGRTLMEIMQSPNYSMWGPAEQSFNLKQQQEQQTLADLMQKNQQSAQMHPLKMQAEQANIDQSKAAARTSNAYSQGAEDKNKVFAGIPIDQHIASQTAAMKAKIPQDQLAQVDAEMELAMGAFQAAQANGGVLPLEWQQRHPGLANKFTDPKTTAKMGSMLNGYFMSKPKELSKAADDARALQLRKTPLGVNAPAGGVKPNVNAQLDNMSVLATLAKMKKASEKLAHLKVLLPLMPEEQQKEWAFSVASLLQQANAEANAPAANKMDFPGTAAAGSPQVRPPVDLGGGVSKLPPNVTSSGWKE